MKKLIKISLSKLLQYLILLSKKHTDKTKCDKCIYKHNNIKDISSEVLTVNKENNSSIWFKINHKPKITHKIKYIIDILMWNIVIKRTCS